MSAARRNLLIIFLATFIILVGSFALVKNKNTIKKSEPLKDSPSLDDILKNPRYDQEWKSARITGNDLNFSIKHPKSWYVISLDSLVRIYRPCREICPGFYIDTIPRSSSINDPKQHPDLNIILNPAQGYQILEEKYLNLDGNKTYVISTQRQSSTKENLLIRQKIFYILTNNLIYRIEYKEEDKQKGVYLLEQDWQFGETFERMVQSIKFY